MCTILGCRNAGVLSPVEGITLKTPSLLQCCAVGGVNLHGVPLLEDSLLATDRTTARCEAGTKACVWLWCPCFLCSETSPVVSPLLYPHFVVARPALRVALLLTCHVNPILLVKSPNLGFLMSRMRELREGSGTVPAAQGGVRKGLLLGCALRRPRSASLCCLSFVSRKCHYGQIAAQPKDVQSLFCQGDTKQPCGSQGY